MSGLKTLFEKQKESKIAFKNIESKSVQNFSTDEISNDYVEQYQNSINLYLQDVNFATASNFAKFGSARKYYENTTTRITNYFPYDGSKASQLEFENNLNPFEKYIYLYEYPRSTGYLNFSPNGWGSKVGSISYGFGNPVNKEYVSFYNQNDSNVYDPDNGLRENTRFIFSSGSTVEFWLKKNAYPNSTTQTSGEVIFYAASTGSNNKTTQFMIYTTTVNTSSFYCEYIINGAVEFQIINLTGLSTIADSEWHHYAMTFYYTGSDYYSEMYVDGKYIDTNVGFALSPSVVDFTGSMFCTIGALGGPYASSPDLTGYGKLSGSIDEFRFWNTRRDAKQIGLNYFTTVGGGNNKANTTDLGIYFKFNEGILGDSNIDSVILDYAGRNCNGVIANYSSANRSTGSAITETQENPELGTPILYYNNSYVQSFLEEKILLADEHDFNNNFSLKNSIPSWILDEDANNGDTLTNFLQTISSYLDTLHLQITTYKNVKNKEYLNYKGKAPPFSDLLLTSNGFDLPSLFLNTDIVQSLLNQDSKKTYNEKINDLKNIIYKNIYNNINIIYKSKGTESSIKQLIKNFGVDDNVFSLNIYANNTQYQLEDSYVNKSLKKDYIDFTPFSSSVNAQAVIYQSGSNSFITGTNNPIIPFTLEADVVIPKFPLLYDKLAYQTLNYNTSSVFGIRTANNTENDFTVSTGDSAGLKVGFIYRDDKGYFTLTCQTASVVLSSNIFDNITDDQHWNLSVKLVPVHTASSYNLIFSGYCNFVSDQFREFSVSSSLTYDQGYGLLTNNKRIYIGAERTNITGALVYNSLIKALSVRYWADELEEEELKEHAKDPYNYGRTNPLESYHLSTGSYLPKSESLVLSWDFSNVSSTDSDGKIDVIYDLSSGSIFTNNTISSLIEKTYNGAGYGFIQNASVKNKQYVFSSEQQLPENLYSSQLINILETDDNYYTSNIRPQKYFFAVENSMYDVISKNMLEMFATISEFNNFIGDPTNTYKAQYSKLKYFRKLFFNKVQNEPDLDKYVEIYKWIDDALDSVLYNLLPASANASEKVRTVIENHLLERNKAYYPITPENNVSVDGTKQIGTNGTPPPGSPEGTHPNPAPDPGKSPKDRRPSLDGAEKMRYTFSVDYSSPTGDHQEKFLDKHESKPADYDSVSYFFPRSTATGIQRTKNFVHRSNKYNITHRESENVIENRGYLDLNYVNSSESNYLDKWYHYAAARDDQNLFTSSSYNISRVQINDAINRYILNNEKRYASVEAHKQKEYHQGYNFDKEKLALFVEEHILQNPEKIYEFLQDPDKVILTIADLNIKNILIYQNSLEETNTTLPGIKTNIGSFSGHHKDGLFENGLQGTFTEQHVGGYKHRHIKVGNNENRPERFLIEDSGSTIIIKSPLSSSSGINYNNPYSRFSRENFTKSVVNIKNIPFSNSFGGNFNHNYQLINTLFRRNQNLAFVDQPNNFSLITGSSPYISGVIEHQLPDRRLYNNTYNKSVFVHKFGAPGDVNSTNAEFMDISEEFSPYNTVNYRNSAPRFYLKSFLSTPSYFGGYKSASYGVSSSFQKQNRNNRRIPISGSSNYRLREDNGYVNYSIPATDGGYLWIKNYAANTGSEGLYVNGIDNSIAFVTKSADNYFSPISASYITLSTSSITLNTSENNVLRKYLTQYNNLWNFNTKQQLSYKDNIWSKNNRKNNYYSDTIYDPNNSSRNTRIIRFKDSFIKDKHKNIINVYVDKDGNEEKISIPFGEGFQSIASDFYRVEYDRNINIYSDDKNIRNSNKKNSTYFKLISFDRYAKNNNLNTKKIKKVIHQEKIYPRSQNAYRDFARIRNAYSQSWADSLDDRLTQLTNSQGQVYVRNLFLNKDSSGEYKYSYWPLDASTTYNSIIRDKSGELTQLDNISFYYSRYGFDPGLIVSSGSYFGARFGRNWNVNRPANVVHEQAGVGAYNDSYEDYYSDIKLMGQGCSIVPEYRISTKLDDYYSGNIGFYDDQFNSLEITGTVIEDATIAVSTSSAFVEQRLNSDYIELTDFFNKELPEYKLNTLKLKVKAIKKLLPYDDFYPQNRMLKLSQQFSSSYNNLFTLGGSEATFRTALTPFYSPGIAFNSIKAGISMPFAVAHSSSASVYNDITSSWSSATRYFYKMPWESILYPYKNLTIIPKTTGASTPAIYDVDYDMRLNSTASIKNPDTDLTINFDRTYDFMANNFYSEVINFFKNKNKLTNIETIPDNEWYFPDLTKKYSLDIFINKSADYTTYSGMEGYGTKPYHFHLPPWHRVAAATSFDSASNLDEDLAPNNSYYQLQASARIIFDPGLISSSSPQYYAGGKFTFEDIKKYSTIEYSSYIIKETNVDSNSVVNISDLMEIFSFSDSNRTWKPRVNWECPTADLNFYGVSAKLTNSSGNDSGDGSAGNAIRGIWHQYGAQTNNQTGLIVNAKFVPDDRTLTGSLLDVVKFDTTKFGKVGETADFNEISEALIIIPFYSDECGSEKYFDIEINKFENLYENNLGVVGQLKNISRKYNLPPKLDYIRFRDLKAKRLEKREYGLIKSPFLMFAFEFSSVLTKSDLLNIWQGVMPSISTKAEIDYIEKEFFIGEYLEQLNYKLPDSTRFKVFKVKKRAITNYQQIIDKTNDKDYIDLNYGYNWPYDFCSLAEMVEVKAEMTYEYDINKDTERVTSETLSKDITSLSMEATTSTSGGASGAPTPPRANVPRTTNRTAVVSNQQPSNLLDLLNTTPGRTNASQNQVLSLLDNNTNRNNTTNDTTNTANENNILNLLK